jgi:hypothetical protein
VEFSDEDYFGENVAVKETHVMFRLTADSIVPDEVTQDIGMTPSRAFAKGEHYEIRGTRGQRPIGHWSLNSGGAIESTSTQKHANYILEQLEPRAEAIEKYLTDPDVHVSVVFWWETSDGHGGFYLRSDTLERLCRLCNDVSYHFVG